MGDNWRSQLQSDPDGLQGDSPHGDIILRPSATSRNICDSQPDPNDDSAVLAEERAHSLRMRRCGAVAICAQDDIPYYDAEQMREVPPYLFGWPDSGGVWVVQPPEPTPEHPSGDYRTDEEIMEQTIERRKRWNVYYALVGNVKQQQSMEDVCRVLEEAGARFYAAVEDSPEAVELNLC